MKNEAIHKYLVDSYNQIAYTHSYVFGYVEGGMIYGARVMNAKGLLPYITCLDCASSKNGGTIQLKYKPNRQQISIIIQSAREIKPICSVEYFESVFHSSNQNRGQIFEKFVAIVFGGHQVDKKNSKFTESGDIVISRTHYQVKYLRATFTDEKTLKNFGI